MHAVWHPRRLYKNVINTNCIRIDDPFLHNKKDSRIMSIVSFTLLQIQGTKSNVHN